MLRQRIFLGYLTIFMAKGLTLWAATETSIAYLGAGLGTPSINVIDLKSSQIIDTIDLPQMRSSLLKIVVTPDNKWLYAINEHLHAQQQFVYIYDLENRAFKKRLALGYMPFADMLMPPDGKNIYISTCGSYGDSPDTIWQISTETQMVIEEVSTRAIQSPLRMVMTKDGSKIYAMSEFDQDIVIIDTATNLITDTMAGCSIFDMALSPDEKILYGARAQRLCAYDVESKTLLWEKDFPFLVDNLIASTAGNSVYATIPDLGAVEIDLATFNVTELYKAEYVSDLHLNQDCTMYLTDYHAGELVLLNLDNKNVISRVSNLMKPWLMIIHSKGI